MLKKRFKIGEIIKSMFPNLPTDNLYKFIFVGCLFLIGVGFYFFVNIFGDLTTSYDKYKVESVKLDIDYNKLKLEYSKTENLINDSNSNPYENDKILARLDSSVKSFTTNEIILNNNIGRVESKIKILNSSIPYLCFLLLALVVIAITFGCKWYYRLQIHQDKILKSEADKL